ncbi:hypothetical protein [Anaerosacchariphilus polymeriproducens]|uniref:Uncharacterized protein n=1 Tax=Anaerosacchariphilus polymeriproducens TaxID=1812858 RepID=A0A371AUV4_9FIRM|nr:hypothetical protein [Anaerosacchariphilus polymeriproducens]RDU23356.1 hypothetical protein DWV06_09890 [Anaerosacchariphilus polymeriproducens]
MLNLLKWNYINLFKKYQFLITSYIITLIILLVTPNKDNLLCFFINGIGAIYSIFFCFYTLVLSVTETVNWMRCESALLEFSLCIKPIKIFIGKLALVMSLNLFSLILTKTLWYLLGTFGMKRIVLFQNIDSFLMYLICSLVFYVIIMFSYILAKSFHYTRKNSKITTVFLCIMIPALILILTFIFLATMGAWNITTAPYGQILIEMKDNFTAFTTLYSILLPIFLIIAGLLCSSHLFKYKFERY